MDLKRAHGQNLHWPVGMNLGILQVSLDIHQEFFQLFLLPTEAADKEYQVDASQIARYVLVAP
jgi:hypothetical protein